MKIMIAIPTGNKIPSEFVVCLYSLKAVPNTEMSIRFVPPPLSQELATEKIVDMAIKENFDYIFLLCDDVLIPSNSLQKLYVEMLNNPKIEIISGIIHFTTEPLMPILFEKKGEGIWLHYPKNKVVECYSTGVDVCLIKVSLLKKLKKKEKGRFFETIIGEGKRMSCDQLFFQLLHKHHFQHYIDTSVQAGHLDRETYEVYFNGKKYKNYTAMSKSTRK